MSENAQIVITVIVLLIFLAPFIFFLVEQQIILKDIRPENRLMRPGQVWLQLIPVFNMVYQFIVVARIADSIRNELVNSPSGSWLESEQVAPTTRPTYSRGLTMCILGCCTIIPIPLLKSLIFLTAIIFWILYWVQLRQYHAKVRHQLGMV